MLCDIVKFCFMGDVFSPPASVVEFLRDLVMSDSALVLEPNGDSLPLLKVHPWPSWLTKGSAKVVDCFINFFYKPSDFDIV